MRSNRQRLPADIADVRTRLDKFEARLDDVVAKIEALAAIAREDTLPAFTIKQFCARNGLSESAYHRLRRKGRGPQTIARGSMGVAITREAEGLWRKQWIEQGRAEAATRPPHPTGPRKVEAATEEASA